jgi:hypothetical protein
MTPKMTQKNYEAIKIYNQKEKIFELKGQIQTLKQQLKVATEDLYVIANNANPDFNRMEYAKKSLKVIKELEE